MSNELTVAHCPSCGKIYQMNIRNLCQECSETVDTQVRKIEKILIRNRQLNMDELVTASEIPRVSILSLIRTGKLKLYDYPNLADECSRCSEPIRSGTLCLKCSTKIQDDIAYAIEQERLLKERIRAGSYLSKKD